MNWYPGMPTTQDFYPAYTGGYAAPYSDNPPPPINSSVGVSGGVRLTSSNLSTIGWGLALLAIAFIVMHVTERE